MCAPADTQSSILGRFGSISDTDIGIGSTLKQLFDFDIWLESVSNESTGFQTETEIWTPDCVWYIFSCLIVCF